MALAVLSAEAQTTPDAVATFGAAGGNVVVWGCDDGIQAYSIKGGVCNIGMGALYGDVTGEHVMWTSNLYRLHDNRFEQIGMSWIKHDDWTSDEGPCLSCGLGLFDCNASVEGALDSGCSDVYDSCLNGYQHYGTYLGLGPRSQTNPWSGAWPVGGGATYCGTSNAVDCRLQVKKTDFSDYSGAQYFLEEQVVHPDESATDRYNNVSYKPATVGSCLTSNCDADPPPCGEALSCTGTACSTAGIGNCVYALKVGTGSCSTHSGCNDSEPCTQDSCIDNVCQHVCWSYTGEDCETNSNCNDSDSCTTDSCVEDYDEPPAIFCEYTCPGACMACCKEPAINAWKKIDSSVVETDPIGVSGEGKFILAAKAWQVPNTCLWNYEYALYNMNSDRSAKSFSVPLPTDLSTDDLEAVRVSAVAGFHDIAYHSGEESGHDGTDWDVTVQSGSVKWQIASGSTNALSWGTLYNFGFETKRAANSTLQQVTIEYLSGSPASVYGNTKVPTALSSGGGACCKSGDCWFTTQTCCSGEGGSFRGTNTDCRDCDEDGITDECESFLGKGACCLTDYSCIHTPSSDCCDEAGGVHWYGLGTNCGNIDCNEGPMGPQGP